MRDKLIKITKSSLVKHIDKTCKLAENIADDLLAYGVIVPPCKVGDKFYSVLEEFGEHSVCESEIIGVLYERGKWFVESKDGEFWEIGTILCLLNRDEAEKALAERNENGKRTDN